MSMDPKYAQHHDGVEEEAASATTEMGAAPESAQAPLHQQSEPSEMWEEEMRPAQPSSTTAPTSALRQINEEEISDVVVPMEPKKGDSDQIDTSAGFDAWINLPLEEATTELEAAEVTGRPDVVVVSMENLLGNLGRTDAVTSAIIDAWINLPRDMCRLILDRLDAFSILSFPLVCKPWAKMYAEKRRLQPGAPTLLTSPSDCGWEIHDDWLRGLFFINNISSREVFSVEVEGLRCGRWIGGKDEWLVVVTGQAANIFKLLNPITGTYIPLPNNLQGYHSCDRVQLCQTPTQAEPDDYFVISISANMLAYTTARSHFWITLQNPNVYWLSYSDAILHRGKILAICRSGNLWFWDLDKEGENPRLLMSSCIDTHGWKQFDFILAPSVNNHNILIVSPYGDYVPIRWGSRNSCHSSSHRNFLVDGAVLHEVDIDAQSIKEVRGIGDRALFLGPNYPFYVPVTVPSGDLEKNHAYIADVSDDDAVAIDLSLEDIPGNVSLINYSGPSNPYQVPIWFRPAFP